MPAKMDLNCNWKPINKSIIKNLIFYTRKYSEYLTNENNVYNVSESNLMKLVNFEGLSREESDSYDGVPA